MIIKQIIGNKSNGMKLIVVPKFCDLKVGDYVYIIKVNDPILIKQNNNEKVKK